MRELQTMGIEELEALEAEWRGEAKEYAKMADRTKNKEASQLYRFMGQHARERADVCRKVLAGRRRQLVAV